MNARHCIFFILVSFLTAACSHQAKRSGNLVANTPRTAETHAAPSVSTAGPVFGERLGTVHVIGTKRRFVLVETPSAQPLSTLADGQALVCRAAGVVTSTLRVSHERRPPFVVADVTAGEPNLNDEVFIDKNPGHTTIPTTANPASSAASSPPPAAAPDFRANPALPPPR